MSYKPEALRLADSLDTATAVIHRLGNDVLLDFGDGTETVEKAAAELRRLHAAIDWIQELQQENVAMLTALEKIVALTVEDRTINRIASKAIANGGKHE